MEKSIHTEMYKVAVNLLKEERQSAGISQEEIAKRLGTTQTFVSKCERRERRLDLVESYQFCEAIGFDFIEYSRKLHDRIEKMCAEGRKKEAEEKALLEKKSKS